MVEILYARELLTWKDRVLRELKLGKIAIYPTDTIYGIGCNALFDESVKKIREIKKRPTTPFSVIAPYREWIPENCTVDEKYLDKLPGPFTFLCKTKGKIVSEHVNPGLGTLGVRLPDNWFSTLIAEMDIPFVTTSVNKAGERYMTSLEDIDHDIVNQVDFIIYDGPKNERPSTIIDFTRENVEVIER
jgi:tRNA threonylcarbamoyl adenosine modification protein (Sua5/YciO/YrdC/YwlC family)